MIMLSTRSARKLFAIDIRGKLFNFPEGKNCLIFPKGKILTIGTGTTTGINLARINFQ